ncbi:hypothetical protein H0H93_011437 [Arthromyces matolae]|nr:hypothetical protein H0H93_011437 [Arthromyces matolae]
MTKLSIGNELEALGPALADDVVQVAKGLPANAANPDEDDSTLVAREYNYDEIIEPFNRTNHPLGSAQASILKSDLENRAANLLALHHEILRLQFKTINISLKKLQLLHQTRVETQKEHDLRQYWFSSVRVLPTDVLMTIFLYAALSSAHLDSPSSPLKLSQVCSSWRTVAQACPSVWNELAVDLRSSKTSSSGEKLGPILVRMLGSITHTFAIRLYQASIESRGCSRS